MAPVVPLKNLVDLVSWEPKYDNSSIPDLPSSYCGLPKRRRTLVCHDYAGGYGKDNSVVPLSYDNDYLFFHWQYCDIFVYFSHHLTTIPPDGWVSAAHRNSVPILGTLITEGTNGSAICEAFLNDEKFGTLVANQLVEIAVHHKLQGWLINIESDLERDSVQPLIKWLEYLRQKVHCRITHGMVIWYDSVIMSGSVQHQNELNANNIAFYEASDAIFLNYWWSEGELKNSLEAAWNALAECSSNMNMPKTQHDIYVGVDVFGRKTFGGGEFSCNLAVSVCSSLDMSVAIFAPGWTHENATSTDFHNSDAFLKRDVKFWNLLAPLLPKPDANYIDIPFSTTFCNGIVFPKSVELESDVDTGVVQTLKASMMYSLGETSMVPRCGPLFSYYLQLIAQNYNWDILDFNLAIPVEIFESSDWIRLLHVAFTPRDKIKMLMKYRFSFRSDISKYVPENIRAAFVIYSSSELGPVAADVRYGYLDSRMSLCECEYQIDASTGQQIIGAMIVLGNLRSTHFSNFVPMKDDTSSSPEAKIGVASNETRRASSLKVLLINDCDIYCTLESSSCMLIVDKIELS